LYVGKSAGVATWYLWRHVVAICFLSLLSEVFCRFGPDPCVICDFADCFLCLFGGFISLMVVDSKKKPFTHSDNA
jgi:hypothetical protein